MTILPPLAARLRSWNSTPQEVVAYVYVPGTATLHARLMLRDSRGNQVNGPWWPAAGGVWTQIRLPDAHVDPGHRILKAAVQFVTPAGAPAWTGSVWIDFLHVKGVTTQLTDSSTPRKTAATFEYGGMRGRRRSARRTTWTWCSRGRTRTTGWGG